ncbi:LpqB family beta-propeller domain-containing protein [Pseudactinotalea sp.]|uniref:LpqB family beta-propeller domain-containing protein n=1 Tax=Pseudactinotalea sp. TaxID=1926260 RepID=UPI003B3B95B9
MRRRACALAVLMVTVMTGCLALPTDGSIQQGFDAPPVDSGLELVAPGPADDVPPEDIVQGFLLASSFGLGDDFGRAREFMTAAGASQWNALDGVIIYSDAVPLEVTLDPEVPGAVGRSVTVRATVAATVAPDGTYTEAAPGTEQEFHYQLVQIVGDQWRISQLGSGVLMSEVTFGTQYREVPIYFLSGDDEPRLVPDLRWLPRSRTVTNSVRALLGGPADWLTSPAVVTAFPGGTSLALEGVAIDDRVATVSLSSEFLTASPADRAYAQKQLAETLRQLGQVNRVQISVDGNVLPIEEELAPIGTTPVPVRGPVVIRDGALSVLSGSSLSELAGGHTVPEGLGSIALPYEPGAIVGLVDSRSLVALSEGGGEPTALLPVDEQILAPSYDVHGWVWTGPTGAGSNTGALEVVHPLTGATASVPVPDLAGADVVALRVSREGARITYAVRTNDAVVVAVAAIERDAGGRPVAVSQGQPIGAPLTNVRELMWVDDVEIAVLGADSSGDVTVRLLGVGGQTAPLPSVEGAISIAAGDGRRELYLATQEGDLYGRSGNGWRRIDGGAESPAFSG